MEPGTIITVDFEDHGQDFLQWDICNGVVVDCRPFQSSVWVNCRLVESMEALKAGHRLLCFQATWGAGPRRIKYPLESVTARPARAEQIPCFICGEDFSTSLALQVKYGPSNEEHESYKVLVCPVCAADQRILGEGALYRTQFRHHRQKSH
jgi:hypothetical protein